MDSKAKIAAALVVTFTSACATTHGGIASTSGPTPGNPVPLLHTPTSWDEVFERLVDHCPSPSRNSSVLSGDVVFTAGWVLASLGIGAWIISQRQIDDATVLAGSLGVVAGAGEITALVLGIRSRRQAQVDFDDSQQSWRDQWRTADPEQRRLLLDAVAASCGEEDELSQARTAMGVPNPAPPAPGGPAIPDAPAPPTNPATPYVPAVPVDPAAPVVP